MKNISRPFVFFVYMGVALAVGAAGGAPPVPCVLVAFVEGVGAAIALILFLLLWRLR
jgi:hypothetical protein